MEEQDHRTPGQLIRKLLEDRGWTQRVFAVVWGVTEQTANLTVQGKRDVSAEDALALGAIFGVEPERFMDLQKRYELARARMLAQEADTTRIAQRAALLGSLPVMEMMRRGWLETVDIRKVGTVESALCRFFGAEHPEDVEFLPHAAKKTQVSSAATPAQLAWLYRVRQIAAEMLIPKYAPGGASSAVARLKSLLSDPELTKQVPRILAESGIRYVVVESLPAAKIDGVCFWLDDTAPVIGMSLRFDRNDNFWFVLRHELEHVAQEHGRAVVMLDAELEGVRAGVGQAVADEERVANAAASDFCVPTTKMDQFIARKAPFFAERDILGFARTLKIHPGIVAGQLQHRTGRYDRFRNHQVKVRSIVAPSAYHDGWGDIYPVGE
jgi:HTH-type transcriptional regulator/antitoxin HigA